MNGQAKAEAERDATLRLYTDEQAAHALTAEAFRKCIRRGDKEDEYRVERDKARIEVARLRAALEEYGDALDEIANAPTLSEARERARVAIRPDTTLRGGPNSGVTL